MEERLLRLPEVIEMTGLSRSTIGRMEAEKKFPKRVKVSESIITWKLSEIQKWIKQQKGE